MFVNEKVLHSSGRSGQKRGKLIFYILILLVFIVTFSSVQKANGMDKIVFVSDSAHIGGFPNADLYIMNSDGSGVTRLTTNPAIDNHPDLSPDGSRIVFSSDRDGDFEIYVADLSDVEGTLKQLTFNTYADRHPHFSPDGTKIIFDAKYRAVVTTDTIISECSIPRRIETVIRYYEGLCIIDTAGTVIDSIDVRNADPSFTIWPNSFATYCGHPSFSPNGSKIIFSAAIDTDARDWEVYVMDWHGGSSVSNLRRVTYGTLYPPNPNPIKMSGGAHFSKDGTKIFFTSTRTTLGNSQIFEVSASATNMPIGHPEMKQLTHHCGNDYVPEPLNDTLIAFTSDRDTTNLLCDRCPPGLGSPSYDLDIEILPLSLVSSSPINITNNNSANEMLLIGDEVSWFCGLPPNLSSCVDYPKIWEKCSMSIVFDMWRDPGYLPTFFHRDLYPIFWQTINQYMSVHEPNYWQYIIANMKDSVLCHDWVIIPTLMPPITNSRPTLNPVHDTTISEGQSLTFAVSATDPESDSLYYSASSLPQGASFDPSLRTFRWTPDFKAGDSFFDVFVDVTDGIGGLDLKKSRIHVVDVNRPPKLNAIPTLVFFEGDSISFVISGEDEDNDSLTFIASNLPSGASFNPTTATFTWKPAYAQASFFDVFFEITDPRGGLDSQTARIQVYNSAVGEVNKDGKVTVADVVYLVSYLFKGGPVPDPLYAADANGDCLVTLADIVYLVNYLFKGGPVPIGRPYAQILSPVERSIINGRVQIVSRNFNENAAADSVVFEYAGADSIWHTIPARGDTVDLIEELSQSFARFWDTDSLTSGEYRLRVTMLNTSRNCQGVAERRVIIDKKPTASLIAAYDTSTHLVTFNGTGSSDPEGPINRWLWEFLSDSSNYAGSVIQKLFLPGDSCYLRLTVTDGAGNWQTYYATLHISISGILTTQETDYCRCIYLSVYDNGEIPKGSGLDFNKTNGPNPNGGKKLGPVDRQTGTKADYFIVRAWVEGKPCLCKFEQLAKRTYTYDNATSHKQVKNDKGEVVSNHPYDGSNGLGKDGPSTGIWEKKGNEIRWIDAPGDRDVLNADYAPNGLKWQETFKTRIYNSDGSLGCECEFEYGFEYNAAKVKIKGPSLTLGSGCYLYIH